MILRKPYAFLIKYFQKINILLLVAVLFCFYNVSKFHQFAKNYVNIGIYNSQIDSISNYINSPIVLVFIIIFVITAILIYLLKVKQKPIIGYILVLIANLYSFIILIYANNFFTYKADEGFKIVTAKVISDLSFIGVILYYPLLIILLIRSLGIDLKSFGFQEDKEYLEISEEDREEVEVQVGFDKEKWTRKMKYYFRNTKYFIIEHKVSLSVVFLLVFTLGAFQFYKYFYIDNKVYSMNETISSNNYKLRINNTYLTDKDYSGNVVAYDGSYFIIVDITVQNTLSRYRTFDMTKVLLYIDNAYYAPSTKYNNHFKDMGNLYKGKEIKPKETTSYILVYQVPKPKKDANFILKYQDTLKTKLIQVKIKVLDISTFKEKGKVNYPKVISIPLNLNDKYNFKISSYEIGNTANYTYKTCNSDGSCPIYEKTITAPDNKKIIHLKFSVEDKERDEFLNFINSFCKVRYIIEGQEKIIAIKNAVSVKYKGNHVYLLVPSEIENASSIDLLFTVRAYQYTYRLKGE